MNILTFTGISKGFHKIALNLLLILILSNEYQYNNLVKGAVRGNDYKDLWLTTSEKYALDEFTDKVMSKLPENYMQSDFYLIRWLRARNFNIQRAQDMLFQNLKWRQDNKINEILKEDFSDMMEDFPATIDSHDKQFRPVVTMDLGQWDLRAAVLQGRLPRLLRYIDWIQETMVHRIIKAQEDGLNVTRAVTLVDTEGMSLVTTLCPSCLSVFVRMTAGMESHFPGFWEEIIVINVPPTSRVGVDAVRPVISPQTRQILKIFDTNKREWNSYLDERISKDQRTLPYGGIKKPKYY